MGQIYSYPQGRYNFDGFKYLEEQDRSNSNVQHVNDNDKLRYILAYEDIANFNKEQNRTSVGTTFTGPGETYTAKKANQYAYESLIRF